ncbi:alpha-glucan family phosphorylase [Sulfuricystis thermophila]|uniref:alpha-glucan family phosphorylase n=1 Tax=Sulfuricystis thermophila TaxID=2496847 RepID=UPI0010368416|nr:alpha-glucan family phosphorylase [Sulfuricystis thermophila]
MTFALTAQLPHLPPSFVPLIELALDLRWSWSHSSDVLWERVCPELWEHTKNPWLVLQNTSQQNFTELAADPEFLALMQACVDEHAAALAAPTWFETAHRDAKLAPVAYFSMEFGLSDSLPIYSGGLGILAGDCLKTASDLGVPMVGIGLLWQQGYFRQSFDAHGNQQEYFPYNDPTQLPIQPVLDEAGDRLRVELPFPGRNLRLRVWQVTVGRIRLYLLDSNDPLNTPADRGITAELYGGGLSMRLKQEICLGMGGWLLLRRLGITPQVCHLNEGHAAFVVLARAASHMRDHGVDFQRAFATTRPGNVFTTHTPVEAGFDRFPPTLIERHLDGTINALGISQRDFLALGRVNPDDDHEPFNMALLAIRGSLHINAVSELHGQVSRRLFQPLFPRWPEEEVPVIHVTNGVHVPSWDSADADRLWTAACGKSRWLGETKHLSTAIRHIPDEALWAMRIAARQNLIRFARLQLERQLAANNAPIERIEQARHALDPNSLTLGFARRFVAYKRPNLLLADPERLYRLLSDPHQPVQLVIAGKAPPQDESGREMVRQWNAFIDSRPDLAGRIVFLADYNMVIAEQLVQGVDLWINTPRRPWEACGTSGMKILVNGGLNLSELDGWWAEAWAPEIGWAVGDRREHDSDPAWDHAEAETLYDLLENEIVPLFYRDRDASGCPRGWIERMRSSMATLTPRYSSNRMLREYVDTLYLPAAAEFLQRANDAGFSARLIAWQEDLRRHWPRIHFGELNIVESDTYWHFSIPVYLDELDPNAIVVELYAQPLERGARDVFRMQRGKTLDGAFNAHSYAAEIPKRRPVGDYTPRIVPFFPGAVVPLEAREILWYR